MSLVFPVSGIVINVLPKGVYCCLTGTTCTLFTTVSTVITLVTVLIGCCVSELLCPHRNVWPKIVYTRTTLFTDLFT